MERHYDVNDLAVAIGLAATVFSGYLLMTAANGTFQTGRPQQGATSHPTGILASMVWLQPALGQAILDESLLERDGPRAITESATNLSRALMAQHRFDSSPRNLNQIVEDKAARMKIDHHGRVQTVMGRAIVNFSQRGWRNGMVPPGFESSEFNTRMIHATETMGQRLDGEFSSAWQPTLGRTIVDTSRELTALAGQVQERTGRAIMQVTQAQTRYEDAHAANQHQLAGVLTAIRKTQQVAEQFERLAMADKRTVGLTDPRSWPEIPVGYFIAASAALLGIFGGSLAFRSGRSEEETVADMKFEALQRVYRKIA
ncbi:MAG: hypothetical protein NW703_04450 [Nitrospiraceae bacterium]